MARTDKTQNRILNLLCRDLFSKYNITSLAKKLSSSRMGIWKALKRLESSNLINLIPVGEGKTSAYKIKLNWENPLVEKNIITILLEEAIKNARWRHEFAELENKTEFIILYGSVLQSAKEAKDIDIISIIHEKGNFMKLNNAINKAQSTETKKIHAINFSKEGFKKELISEKNPAFLDAIEKGVILFGQENFIKLVKGIVY